MADLTGELTSMVTQAIESARNWLTAVPGETGSSAVTSCPAAIRILGLEVAGGLTELSSSDRTTLAGGLRLELAAIAGAKDVALHRPGTGLGLCAPAEIVLHALDALSGNQGQESDAVGRETAVVAAGIAQSLAYPLEALRDLGGAALASASGSALTGLVHGTHAENRADAPGAYHAILDHLEEVQDPLTGSWGRLEKDGASTLLMTAARVLPFFLHVHRPANRLARLTDFVLHRPGWAIRAESGTEWLDLAAISLLAGMISCGYREAEIRAVLLEGSARLMALQADDGSFAAVATIASLPDAARSIAACDRLQSTWLRVLALRNLAWALESDRAARDGPFRRWPGPGYRPPGSRLSSEDRAAFDRWNRLVPSSVQHAAPRVAVVIPCYNLGAYLPEAIASVERQTLRERELIIVDDGSTDDVTLLMLEACERAGFRLIRQENGGVAAARNTGIRAAQSPYVCCLDPDDRLTADFLCAAATVLDEQPDVAIVSGDLKFFDGMDNRQSSRHTMLPDLLVDNGIVEPAIFRRSLWAEVGGYRGGFSVTGVEDWDLWLTIVERGHRVVALPEIVWEYRLRPGQMSAIMFRPENWSHAYRELMDRHIETVRAYLPEMLEGQSQHWAVTNAWAREQARGSEWWQREAAAHRGQFATETERETQLRAWIAEIEQARQWDRTQAANWERIYLETKAISDERARWIEELEAARDWHRSQMENWRREAEAWHRIASDRAAQIASLEARQRRKAKHAPSETDTSGEFGEETPDEPASA